MIQARLSLACFIMYWVNGRFAAQQHIICKQCASVRVCMHTVTDSVSVPSMLCLTCCTPRNTYTVYNCILLTFPFVESQSCCFPTTDGWSTVRCVSVCLLFCSTGAVYDRTWLESGALAVLAAALKQTGFDTGRFPTSATERACPSSSSLACMTNPCALTTRPYVVV